MNIDRDTMLCADPLHKKGCPCRAGGDIEYHDPMPVVHRDRARYQIDLVDRAKGFVRETPDTRYVCDDHTYIGNKPCPACESNDRVAFQTPDTPSTETRPCTCGLKVVADVHPDCPVHGVRSDTPSTEALTADTLAEALYEASPPEVWMRTSTEHYRLIADRLIATGWARAVRQEAADTSGPDVTTALTALGHIERLAQGRISWAHIVILVREARAALERATE
jgi:hypothetical protein